MTDGGQSAFRRYRESRFPHRITNTLLENKYRNYRTKMFEKYYPLKSPDQKITAQQIER
jgi:hypothetical protein